MPTIGWILVGIAGWLLFCVLVVRSFGLMRRFDEAVEPAPRVDLSE